MNPVALVRRLQLRLRSDEERNKIKNSVYRRTIQADGYMRTVSVINQLDLPWPTVQTRCHNFGTPRSGTLHGGRHEHLRDLVYKQIRRISHPVLFWLSGSETGYEQHG